MKLLRLWFSLYGRVSQKEYILTGVGLMIFKYVVDAALVYAFARAIWTPIDYLMPIYDLREAKLAAAPQGFQLLMGLWTLPFIWIGASMSMGRALDAGRSPWAVVLFFVPLVNYLYILRLACLKSHEGPLEPSPRREVSTRQAGTALITVMVCALLTVALMLYSVFVTRHYGAMLFLGTPFTVGGVAGYLYNRGREPRLGSTLVVATASVTLAGGLLMLFALEGVVCIAMALPLALLLALGGAAFGYALARYAGPRPREAALSVALLPLLVLVEARVAPTPIYEVISAIEIDAPPAVVWEHVIGFSDLPAPSHWLFETGIAYPVRATISGEGVGAVRHCEFSTGAFVEPITRWDPPHRLSFDVVQQPVPMEEWSFYRQVHPPHLEGSFRSVRGEFRLVPLAGGRTRLEGSTWYELELLPFGYWRVLADAIVHRIHARVLAHVKQLSES